jgi:hypothetical protein
MATSTVLSKVTLTELDAVNQLLASVDISPVSSLGGSTDLEVQGAITRLSNINRSVQGMGWDFNTRLEILYVRNVSNEITIPTNVLRISPSGRSIWKDLVLRGGKVWDRDKDVDGTVLTEDVYLDVVELLNFEDLPQSCRDYITARAVREHERFESSDDTKTEVAQQAEITAWATLINDHSVNGQETIEDNVNVFSSIFGRE